MSKRNKSGCVCVIDVILPVADRGVAEADKRGEPKDEGSAGHHPPDARDAAPGDDHQGRPLQGQHHLTRQQGTIPRSSISWTQARQRIEVILKIHKFITLL